MSVASRATGLRLLCVPTTALRGGQSSHASAPWLLHAVPSPPAAQPAPAGGLTGLLARLRQRAVDFATGQWQQVQTAESGAKLYVKRMATTLLRNVTEEETFLRAVVPAEAPLAVVLHAPEAASSCVLRHLSQLAAERRDLHRKWFYGNVLALGVTLPLSLIPVLPALPLYWNAFRLWSHRGAWRGAAQLKLLLHSPLAPEPQPPCTRLGACEPGECCRVPPAWAAQSGARLLVLPCQNLSHLAAAAGEGAAEMEAAAELAERVLGATGLAGRTRERLQAVAS